MKCRFYLILNIFLFFVCTKVFATDTIKVVTEELPPYNYIENKEIKGISTAIVREVLKRSDIDATFKIYPWPRAYKMALNLPNILIYSIAKSEQREKLFQWVRPIINYSVYLYALKNSNVEVSNLEEAKKYRIGVINEDISSQYLLKNGFEKDKQLIVFFDREKMVQDLFNNKLDFVCLGELVASSIIRNSGPSCNPEYVRKVFRLDLGRKLYMAFSRWTDKSLVSRCQNVFDQMVKDGTYDRLKTSSIAKIDKID